VANGLGAAITSELAAKGMDNCKIIDITDVNVNRTIYIIYSRSSADPGTKKLVDFLTEKGRELLKNN
jgi:DNA-binding transcriptional LysR family regulator